MLDADPIEILKGEFAERRKLNSNYSLRSFAKRISISAGLLSDIMNGKRRLTPSMANRIARRLDMKPDKQAALIQCIEKARAKKATHRSREQANPLSEDQFKIIADWHHYALLSLLKVYPFLTEKKAANKLGIPYFTVKEAVERLMKLGLLAKSDQGQWVCVDGLTTTHDVPNEAIRSFHFQYMRQAMDRLDSQAVDKRDYSTMVMAIDRSKIPEAKILLRNFRRELSGFLESGTPQEAYALTMQLFSLE